MASRPPTGIPEGRLKSTGVPSVPGVAPVDPCDGVRRFEPVPLAPIVQQILAIHLDLDELLRIYR